MRDDLPLLLATLDQAEEMIRDLAKLILGDSAEITTTWDRVNRICDRYNLPEPA